MEELEKADFYATMNGDSMSGANINDGDAVLFIQQDQAENGAIVAATFGGGCLVIRRVYTYPEKNQVVFKADNPHYEPLICSVLDDFKIIGKAIACLSKVA